MADAGTQVLLRVVRGHATAEETAALVAVLTLARAARRAAAKAAADRAQANGRTRSSWGDRTRLSSAPVHHGRGAWRASGLPR